MTLATGAPVRPRPTDALVAVTLALLLGLQPVTTDLYLPGLPALSAEFGGAVGRAQLTLSGLILAFGFGQLLLGPVSDRFGRRPVLLSGLGLYVVGSVCSAHASSLEVLIFGRVLQGVGLAAAVVCGRAMVRDLYDPRHGTLVMSRAQSGLGLFALGSPILGGVLAGTLGWRWTLAATGIVAAVALALVVWRLPETLPQRNPRALEPARMAGTWGRMLRHPTFLAWSLLLMCTYGGLYTFLASSAFVYIEVLGSSRAVYGLFLASASVSYLAGTFACRRWIARHGIVRTVRRAAAFSLVGGVAMAALSLAGLTNPWAICVPQLVFNFGHGIHQSCGQAGVVGPFPQAAGAASALSGFMSAAAAFLIGLWLGWAIDGTVFPLTLTLGLFSVLTAAVGWTLVQRSGDPAAATR
ncbi:MAG: multidrug effflux MFS transporter [Betaproteobacteria bacterium]|jgi:DHA1 family bicyclomycin/chloramphenicol resistance-like MFS transporter